MCVQTCDDGVSIIAAAVVGGLKEASALHQGPYLTGRNAGGSAGGDNVTECFGCHFTAPRLRYLVSPIMEVERAGTTMSKRIEGGT